MTQQSNSPDQNSDSQKPSALATSNQAALDETNIQESDEITIPDEDTYSESQEIPSNDSNQHDSLLKKYPIAVSWAASILYSSVVFFLYTSATISVINEIMNLSDKTNDDSLPINQTSAFVFGENNPTSDHKTKDYISGSMLNTGLILAPNILLFLGSALGVQPKLLNTFFKHETENKNNKALAAFCSFWKALISSGELFIFIKNILPKTNPSLICSIFFTVTASIGDFVIQMINLGEQKKSIYPIANPKLRKVAATYCSSTYALSSLALYFNALNRDFRAVGWEKTTLTEISNPPAKIATLFFLSAFSLIFTIESIKAYYKKCENAFTAENSLETALLENHTPTNKPSGKHESFSTAKIANVIFKVAAMYASTVKLGAQYHNLDEINALNIFILTLMGLLQIPNFGVQLALLDNREHALKEIDDSENNEINTNPNSAPHENAAQEDLTLNNETASSDSAQENTTCAKLTDCFKSTLGIFSSIFDQSESSTKTQTDSVEHVI